MLDENNVWLVPENNEEIEYAKKLIDKPDEFSMAIITYKQLKQLFRLDYIQIGLYNGKYEEILGYINMDNYKFSVKDFDPQVTIDNKYFKPFFKYLIRGLKLYSTSAIKFYYSANKYLVVVEVEGKKGIIACVKDELIIEG